MLCKETTRKKFAEGVTNYEAHNTSQTNAGVLDLVKEYIDLFSRKGQGRIVLRERENLPCQKYCRNLIKVHGLVYHAVRKGKDRLVDTLSKFRVAKRLLREPIFNLDQSGAFFEKIVFHFSKAVDMNGKKKIIQKRVLTEEFLDPITLSPIFLHQGRFTNLLSFSPKGCYIFKVIRE